GVLPDAKDQSRGRGPASGTSCKVSGADDRGPLGGGGQGPQSPVNRPKRRGEGGRASVPAQDAAEEVAPRPPAGPPAHPSSHGRGHNGQQRNLRLAGGGGGPSPRAGSGQAEGLRL